MEQNANEYVEHYIETRNYICFSKEISGECLYLKDYSKVVRGFSNGTQAIPEKFEDENIILIENPTEDEKIILATNLSVSDTVYLSAIIDGRRMLETMSREEAIAECEKKERDFVHDVLNYRDKPEERRLNRVVKSYLDGSLASMSKDALAELGSRVQRLKKKEGLDEAEQSLDSAPSISESNLMEPKENNSLPEVPDIVPVPMTSEEILQARQTSVDDANVALRDVESNPVEEKTQSTLDSPTVESGISLDAYNKMVADVLNGGAKEVVSEEQAPVVVPTVDIQSVQMPTPEVATNIVASSVIPTPESLESMAEAPSFEGTLGGRAM